MFSPNPKNDPLLSAIKGVIAENDKHRDAVDRANHHFKITDKRQLPHNLHAEYDALLKESNNLSEKITKSTPMGDAISDFEKSDAPQFEGKSMEKRRQMAIAAKMAMNEALKGNQHKIDANKNGKVDAHDFKLLRNKNMTAEDVMKEALTNLAEKDSLSEAEVNFLMDLMHEQELKPIMPSIIAANADKHSSLDINKLRRKDYIPGLMGAMAHELGLDTTAGVAAAIKEELKYKVKKGDTLYDLAKEYGTTVDAIVKASGVKNKNKISIDQELVIPGQAAPIPAERPAERTAGDSLQYGELIKQKFPVTKGLVDQGDRLVPVDAGPITPERPRFKAPVYEPANPPPDPTPRPLARNARPANVTARPDTQTGAGAKFGQTDTTKKPPAPPVPVDAKTVRDSQKRYALDMFKNVANAADFDGQKFVDDLTSRYNSKVEPRDVDYEALKIASDETKSVLAQSLGIPYGELTRILGRSKAPVTATPDTQTGAGGNYSQAVKSGNPTDTNTELKTRTVSTYAVDKYGNLTPRAKVGSSPDKQTGASGNYSQADNSGKRVSYSPDKQTGASGNYSQADTRQAAAQRTVGSSFDALTSNDRGSNMTSSAASIEAQRLASRLAAKELAAQKKTISDVPGNSYQPETPAAQLSRIDNLDSELAKRSTERRNRMDTQDSLKNYLNR